LIAGSKLFATPRVKYHQSSAHKKNSVHIYCSAELREYCATAARHIRPLKINSFAGRRITRCEKSDTPSGACGSHTHIQYNVINEVCKKSAEKHFRPTASRRQLKGDNNGIIRGIQPLRDLPTKAAHCLLIARRALSTHTHTP
jgi:hypothetical protein